MAYATSLRGKEILFGQIKVNLFLLFSKKEDGFLLLNSVIYCLKKNGVIKYITTSNIVSSEGALYVMMTYDIDRYTATF